MAKVLIVEDEGILAMKTEEDLEILGHEVVGIADSGEEALEIISNNVPDVILMDIVLQGDMSGIELAELVLKNHPECRIIYVSAHADEITIKKARKTRHAGFLHKPLEPAKLKRALVKAHQ